MDPGLKVMSDRFPQMRREAAFLFERDEDFRDLCENYGTCLETVERLASAGPSAEGLRKEYASLLLRLERELLRYLEEHPSS